MIKERPILFSDPMVRAIIDGTKTQTRRIVKPQPAWGNGIIPMFGQSPCGTPFGRPGHFREAGPDYPDDASDDRTCPYGLPGERLWVREAWAVSGLAYMMKPRDTRIAAATAWRYRATDTTGWQHGWKPSIHMPRWASRITLEVESIRVERLQDISEADAQAEGVGFHVVHQSPDSFPQYEDGYRAAYRLLWDEINGPGSWDTNPWVWVVTFKRLSAA